MLSNKECDLKLCKDMSEYIKNTDGCRGTAGVYKNITIGLSLIPLTGISNFYCGNHFDGIFEIIEGLIVLFAICGCCCYSHNNRVHNADDIPFFFCESFWSFLLAAINIVRYAILASTDPSKPYEFSLMMTSLVISLIFCFCGCANKKCWVVSIIINAIVVGLMEVIRDVYMENDGNGCPFI